MTSRMHFTPSNSLKALPDDDHAHTWLRLDQNDLNLASVQLQRSSSIIFMIFCDLEEVNIADVTIAGGRGISSAEAKADHDRTVLELLDSLSKHKLASISGRTRSSSKRPWHHLWEMFSPWRDCKFFPHFSEVVRPHRNLTDQPTH